MSTWGRRFIKGANAPLVGFKSLFSGPKIWMFAIVPAVVSSGLFILGLAFGIGHIPIWVALFAPQAIGFWGSVLNWAILIASYVLFIILTLLTSFVLSKIMVIPFNSIIAEKVLKHHGVLKIEPFDFAIWLKRSTRILILTVIQTLFFLILGSSLFVLSFLPGLNLITAFLGFLIVAFDCADYAMEIADLSLKAKLKLLRRRLPEFSGFAIVLGLTFIVPFLNFLLLPIAVSGASWLVSSFDELWTKQRIS